MPRDARRLIGRPEGICTACKISNCGCLHWKGETSGTHGGRIDRPLVYIGAQRMLSPRRYAYRETYGLDLDGETGGRYIRIKNVCGDPLCINPMHNAPAAEPLGLGRPRRKGIVVRVPTRLSLYAHIEAETMPGGEGGFVVSGGPLRATKEAACRIALLVGVSPAHVLAGYGNLVMKDRKGIDGASACASSRKIC